MPIWRMGGAMLIAVALSHLVSAAEARDTESAKTAGALHPSGLVEKAKSNAAKYAWAAEISRQIVKSAEPWMGFSDDQLWSLMFGNTIKRSWMVWSNGHCPACGESTPMYTWEMNALERPWKTRCPHCKELFPKNDFDRFYLSGLDEHGIFDPARADRSLLYNLDHPDPNDPLHLFGVDDGEGYVDGEKRWRFIGAYLIYGQWKQAVLGGIANLAAAYAVTGKAAYAHKAGVLLDRVADLYPTFDFSREGVLYEGPPSAGYVSTWHDACVETRTLAIAYDQVFDALKVDAELQVFLERKAREVKLENPKSSFADIQRNIEDRILRDALANRPKTQSNFPQTDITFAIIHTVLGWPGNREEVLGMLGDIITQSTAVDGLTGEKGLAGYSSLSPRSLGTLLGRYSRIDPGFLRDMLKRCPKLHDSYRFHIDTWCLDSYYPNSGDSGAFAAPNRSYCGLSILKAPGLNPSMFTFLWQLYELTGDPAFAQVAYRENGGSVDGLPHDLFAEDPAAFRKRVRRVIDREGAATKLGSVNKEQWSLALLRSGKGKDERVLWLDYDSGGGHGHADGMNLGLFAKGLDLLPEFGYPPVQFGGWGSPRARWYTMTAAHNTVVVDGADQPRAAGVTTLWAVGDRFRAVRASAPEMIGGTRFERTAALVDISDEDCYVVDIFRVSGGRDHAKFVHSHFGEITTRGLALSPASDYGHGTQMRGFRSDPKARPGWSVDWKVEDRYGLLPEGSDIHLRYTDLTSGAEASTAETWVTAGLYNTSEEAWIPRVMVRRQANEAPLKSTFVSIIEPYAGRSSIREIRRLALETPDGAACADSDVAVEVVLADGSSDLIIATAAGGAVVQRDYELRLDGEMCFVRRDPTGRPQRIALCGARSASIGDVAIKLAGRPGFVEITLDGGRATVVAGERGSVEEVLAGGR